MTNVPKFRSGQTLRALQLNRLVDQINQRSTGSNAREPTGSQNTAIVRNSSGADVQLGKILCISSYLGPTTSNEAELAVSLVYDAVNPVWHTSLARAAVTSEPIRNGELGRVILSGQCIVNAPIQQENNANVDETGLEFAMFDPTDPSQMIATTGGIARILSRVNDDYLACYFRQGVAKFRYKLLEQSQAPADTSAELHDDDGRLLGTISLSDPVSIADYQGVDDVGYCELRGNKFFAIEGPC